MTQFARRAWCTAGGVVLLASVVAVPAAGASAAPAPRITRAGRPHIMRPHGAAPLAASTAQTQWGAPHLGYFGGNLLQHVKVVQVLYGGESGGHTYLAQVKGTVTPNVQTSFTQVTDSRYMDWLNEYKVAGQTIGRGSFVGKYTITPDISRNGDTIDDLDIQSELAAQIGASHLPAPDADTVYMLYFPSGKTITITDPDTGDVYTDFCAFHNEFIAGVRVRYGVIPNNANTCQSGVSSWENVSDGSTHELIELVTDPDNVSFNTDPSVVGWIDPGDGEEIADICIGPHELGRVIGNDGFVYPVARMWSNRAGRCVTAKTTSVGDASVLEGDAGLRGVRLPITLSDPSIVADVAVHYTISGVSATVATSATPGVDVVTNPSGTTGTITFTRVNGQTPVRATLLLFPQGDTTVEPDESFHVTLSAPSTGYGLGRSVGTGTILNDDPAPGGVAATVGIGDALVGSGEFGVRQLVFPITLSKLNASPEAVTWTLHSGSATVGTDVLGVGASRATSGVATIGAGSTGVFLYVDVRANYLFAAARSLTVSVAKNGFSLPNVSIVRSSGTGTIVPD